MDKLRIFIIGFLLASGALVLAPITAAAQAASSFTSSHNWSGYAATGGGFTAVSGSWVIPTVSASALGADATWVGIGGIESTDLIQTGTQAIVQNGTVRYNAWYELLPDVEMNAPLEVHAGDSVSASLTYQGSDIWQIDLKNNTTGGEFTTQVAYDSSGSSAEWIEEAPMADRGFIPLDAFGSLSFTAASAVENGSTITPYSGNAQPIAMVNAVGDVIASPSATSTDGTFTVTRSTASSSVALTRPRYRATAYYIIETPQGVFIVQGGHRR